nr:LLM class flavin-dependent oxidoreductase [Nonomuraea basaltis]
MRRPGDLVGPRPATPGGPPLLFGGNSKATLRRIASHGTGWIAGDATVQDVQDFAPRIRQAWAHLGADDIQALTREGPQARIHGWRD